jgi:hypothetical protein
MLKPNFWGGEVELVVMSKMLAVPIYVYVPESEAQRGGHANLSGFVPLVKYGEEYVARGRRPVRLLYTGGNHYDLLLK